MQPRAVSGSSLHGAWGLVQWWQRPPRLSCRQVTLLISTRSGGKRDALCRGGAALR